eukprot:Colp12_sorted_trinity150504_noHs@8430
MGCTSSNAKDAVAEQPAKLGESQVVLSSSSEEHTLGSSVDSTKPAENAIVSEVDQQSVHSTSAEASSSSTQTPVTAGTTAPASVTTAAAVKPQTKTIATLPPLKKGFILKEGHMIKNWKNRFFVLDAGTLTYYESSTDTYPFGVRKKGEMLLKNTTLKTDRNIIYITYEGPSVSGREGLTSLTLEIRYPTEREEWSQAIRSHIAYINATDV